STNVVMQTLLERPWRANGRTRRTVRFRANAEVLPRGTGDLAGGGVRRWGTPGVRRVEARAHEAENRGSFGVERRESGAQEARERPERQLDRGSVGQPGFEIRAGVQVAKRLEADHRAAEAGERPFESNESVAPAPAGGRTEVRDRPGRRDQIETAVRARAQNDPIWVRAQQLDRASEVLRPEAGNVGGGDQQDRGSARERTAGGGLDAGAEIGAALGYVRDGGPEVERSGRADRERATGDFSREESGVEKRPMRAVLDMAERSRQELPPRALGRDAAREDQERRPALHRDEIASIGPTRRFGRRRVESRAARHRRGRLRTWNPPARARAGSRDRWSTNRSGRSRRTPPESVRPASRPRARGDRRRAARARRRSRPPEPRSPRSARAR